MSWDLNHVTLVGRLTRDPEIRYSAQGTAFGTLGIAVNRRVGGKDNVTTDVYYFNVVVLGKLAEICGNYLSKGKQIAVSGYLRQRRWEKNGERFSMVEVFGEQVQFLSTGQSDANYLKRDSNIETTDNNSKNNLNRNKNDMPSDDQDDDIPF